MFSFLFFFGLVAFTQQFGNQEVTVTGTLRCHIKALTPNTTVTLWDDDIIGDDKLNSTMTNSNGAFELFGQDSFYFFFQPFISVRHRCQSTLSSLTKCQCKKQCEYETRIWFAPTLPGEVQALGLIFLNKLPIGSATVIAIDHILNTTIGGGPRVPNTATIINTEFCSN